MATKMVLVLAATTGLLLSVALISHSQKTDPSLFGATTQSAATAPAGSVVANDHDIELTSKDGVISLKLPAPWTGAEPKNPQMELKAQSPKGEIICVYSVLKTDVVSLEAYVKLQHAHDMSSFKNTQSTDLTKLTTAGRPAIRYDYTYEDEAFKWGVVEIIVETSTRYNSFAVTGLRSHFDAQKEEWANLVKGLTEKPGIPKK